MKTFGIILDIIILLWITSTAYLVYAGLYQADWHDFIIPIFGWISILAKDIM